MRKLIGLAILSLVATACQSLSPHARQPANVPYVSEDDRVYNGSVIEFTQDIKFTNTDINYRPIAMKGPEFSLDDGGTTLMNCGLYVELAPRTVGIIKAGRRFQVQWEGSGLFGGNAFLNLYDENGDGSSRARILCEVYAPYTSGAEPRGSASPMTLSYKYLQSSFPISIVKKVGAEEMKVQEIKYSPGDEKTKIQKELNI